MIADLMDRCIGCLLGMACGDALGAAVEFQTRAQLDARSPDGVRDFLPQRRHPAGSYTDDTEMALALGESLLRCGKADATDCGRAYAAWALRPPYRGYGPDTLQILKAIRDGADPLTTGTLVRPEGSWSNGGAMRIAPLALVYRNASAGVLYEAVREALLPTHVHPEAVDAAFVQARALGDALLSGENRGGYPPGQVPDLYLADLQSLARTEAMRERLGCVAGLAKAGLSELASGDMELASGGMDPFMLAEVNTPGPYGDGFQLRAVDAVTQALWAFLCLYDRPEEAVIRAVSFGGDTDTVAAMTGALCGALHGSGWVPHRWFDGLERGEYGREYIVRTAKGLAGLNVGGKP